MIVGGQGLRWKCFSRVPWNLSGGLWTDLRITDGDCKLRPSDAVRYVEVVCPEPYSPVGSSESRCIADIRVLFRLYAAGLQSKRTCLLEADSDVAGIHCGLSPLAGSA